MAVRQGQGTGSELWQRDSRKSKLKDRAIRILLAACAYISIVTTVGIVLVLLFETVRFFQGVSIVEFFTATTWRAGFGDPTYGVLVLAWGTILVTLIAMIVALPVGLGAAVFLSEYASDGLRRWLKPILEVLAGVPTIVYGYFALTLVTPFLKATIFPEMQTFNALSAGLVMGIMIIPTVASVSDDALYAVPRGLREGAYALGATRYETTTKTVVPAALSGISAAFVLGVSRAIGETMIVAVAAGNLANLTANPLNSIQTMTAYIVSVAQGESPVGSEVYGTIFAVGFTLFVMTLILNIIANVFVRRYREKSVQ